MANQQNTQNNSKQQTRTLPKNFRQIGEPGTKKIYMEDYVYTYLNKLAQPGNLYARGAILFGNACQTPAGLCLFISGAAAYISSLYTNSYPAGDYAPGSIYGPSLTQAELDQVAAEVSRFAAGLPLAQMSDTDKVIAAHDFLVQFCTYAPDWSQNRANTAWGALVYGEAQCSGYARAMKALCDAMGVECYYVHASDQADNPDHQWNVVKIDGQYYIIDVQANASSGISASSGLLTSTLLVSDDTYAALGPAWDRASVPACPVNYTGPIYDYIFFQRLDGSYFGARMIY